MMNLSLTIGQQNVISRLVDQCVGYILDFNYSNEENIILIISSRLA